MTGTIDRRTNPALPRYACMPSGVIEKINYEPEHSRLTVIFMSGRVYEYYMVPATVASAFRNAVSKGTFFNKRIRDKYVCREVTPAL
jgi:hypothetical protein